MKHKVVIVESQTATDMTVGGTVYFDSEAEARQWVASHNSANTSQAYVVHVSDSYSMTDHKQKGTVA
jgi:hypothetical protein